MRCEVLVPFEIFMKTFNTAYEKNPSATECIHVWFVFIMDKKHTVYLRYFSESIILLILKRYHVGNLKSTVIFLTPQI